VWCETLRYDELDEALVRLLARHGVDLLLAVRPWQQGEVGDVVRRFQAAGVFVAVWPMLADDAGRWASASTYAPFIAFADALLARAPLADELVIDLEPPIAVLAKWKRGRPTWPRFPSYGDARAAFAAAIARWPVRVTTAILPFVAAGRWLERAFGTPVSELAVARHSAMAYTSLIEGWSRGLVDRRRAEDLLGRCARMMRARFGERAALSLGAVGPGAFGDEPSYRDPGELARDVAIAEAAGITELSLFELGGILSRAPIEPWFEALGQRRTAPCGVPSP
jgi:hypothetical protein